MDGALKRVLAPFIESFDALDRSVLVRSKAGSTQAAPRQVVAVAWRAAFVLPGILSIGVGIAYAVFVAAGRGAHREAAAAARRSWRRTTTTTSG